MARMIKVVALFLAVLISCDAFVVLSSRLPIRHMIRHAEESGAASPAPAEGLKAQLQADMKAAMKSKDKEKLAGVRAIQTAIKQREVDDRIVVDDAEAVNIMSKLVKQRRESIKSYEESGRSDLVAAEESELAVIQTYMPKQLSTEEVEKIIDETIARLGATTIKDMGKVMGELKTQLVGKADISSIGDSLKKKLGVAK